LPECIDALLERRSVRVFREDVPDLTAILRALDIARFAPSAGNRQPWKFVVIRDRSLIEKLSEIHPHARPLKGVGVAVAVYACKSESPVSYLVDGALAALYFWLALHCMGLATVWIQTLRNVEEINRILGAPDDCIPVALFPVGYPGEKPAAKPRKPLSELIYLNKFGEPLPPSELQKLRESPQTRC